MDRNIVYPGSIPLDTDVLSLNRSCMVALGYLIQAVLGTSTVVDGLGCSPTAPASMTVTVGPGSITQLSVVDPIAYGSLAADSSDPLIKMGINASSMSFTAIAPTTSGQSVNYLIEALFQESDANPVVLPYYNAANPSQPFSGANNSGAAQNTQRIQRVQLQMKNGAPATTGSQTTPPADPGGWIGLYSITVGYGQTSITSQNILALPTAPFLRFKLPALGPGFASGSQSFSTSGSFLVPAGVTQIEVEVWGAGSGSFASTSSAASGGGGGGGYSRRRISGLSPGQIIPVTVGLGGSGGTTSGVAPTAGQSSYFGSTSAPYVSASPGAPNPLATVSSGNAGIFPGGGASGAGTGANGTTPFNGAAGANGFVMVRW